MGTKVTKQQFDLHFVALVNHELHRQCKTDIWKPQAYQTVCSQKVPLGYIRLSRSGGHTGLTHILMISM